MAVASTHPQPSWIGVMVMSPTFIVGTVTPAGRLMRMGTVGRFGGVVCAMVTPFDDEGRLDLDGAVRLARHLCDHGNDGLVLAGTTGESPVLSDDEKLDLWRAVSEVVTVPVIAGSGSNDTAHSVEITRPATAVGGAGILAVTPYYSRPPQAGLDAHFRAVAAATHL